MNKIIYQMKRPYWYIQKYGFKAFCKAIGRKVEDKLQIELKRRNRKANLKFLDELMPILEQMPESNGSRYYDKFNIKIGIIADQFLFDAYKGCADFIYITPDNYKEYVDEVAFLWVVSAWRGLNEEWRRMADVGTDINQVIHEAIAYYREHGKKVVFYSKEDPPNYEHFLPIAKECDVIFTSCAEKVDDYKRDCNTENVHVLEFCINPVFHNPVGMMNAQKKKGVFFAGSWMIKYPERVKALEEMLDGVIDAKKPLVIADRNFSMNKITYFFPKKYYSYLVKEIPHDLLQKVHKLYVWAININSITDSKTMFANRVYELQANGCLMISNQSIGVEEKFPNIFIAKTKEETKQILDSFSEDEILERQLVGIRRVMTGETCFDRMEYVLDILGYDFKKNGRSVLVIVDDVDKKRDEFECQTYEKKTIIAYNKLTKDIYEQYDMFTIWDEGHVYGKCYLEDMINAFKYTDVDVVLMSEDDTVQFDYSDNSKVGAPSVWWRKNVEYEEISGLNQKRINGKIFAIQSFTNR